jgi:hypothetical protein
LCKSVYYFLSVFVHSLLLVLTQGGGAGNWLELMQSLLSFPDSSTRPAWLYCFRWLWVCHGSCNAVMVLPISWNQDCLTLPDKRHHLASKHRGPLSPHSDAFQISVISNVLWETRISQANRYEGYSGHMHVTPTLPPPTILWRFSRLDRQIVEWSRKR